MATNLSPIDLSGNTIYAANIKTGFVKPNTGTLYDGFGNLAAGSSLTLTVSNAGQWINMDTASGSTIILPAATGTGNIYMAYVGTSVTSNSHIFKTNGTDTFAGTLTLAGTTSLTLPLSGTNKTITSNGSTTGGLKGSYYWVMDIATNIWLAEIVLVGSGTVTTPIT